MDKIDYLEVGNLSLSDKVYNQIVIRISEGIWNEGDKIPSESKLCEMFNVSRASIRAAIQKLQGQGLIVTRQGVGSFVSSPSMNANVNIEVKMSTDITGDAFIEFFEFRQAIEFKAIDLFVLRATQNDMDNLLKINEKMKTCDKDHKCFTDCDFEFHMAILKGARNSFLYNAFIPYKDAFYDYLEQINQRRSSEISELIKKHEMIYQLLLAKKPMEIKEYLMKNNESYYVTVFKKNQ